MGLAASQARLLSLTSRQHTVEQRAQFLQAQKLRLANDSDTVYENYINALDATKLETRTYDAKGKVHWIDGSLSNLLRYSADDKAAGNIYYVQNIKDGKLYMPKNITNAYNASGDDLYKFLDNMNVRYHEAYNEDYLNAKSILDYDIANGWDAKPFGGDNAVLAQYNNLLAKTSQPDLSNIYQHADIISNLVNHSKNGTGTMYLPWDNSQLEILKNSLNYLANDPTYRSDTVITTLAQYCNNFNITEIFDTPDSINTLKASTSDTKEYYIYYDKAKEDEKEDPATRQSINEIFKLRMLLNGGTYQTNGDDEITLGMYICPEADINKDNKLTKGEYEAYNKITHDVYSEEIKTLLKNFSNSDYYNIGDALRQISTNIKNSEYSKAIQKAENDLDAFLTSKGTDKYTIQAEIRNYNQYCKDLIEFNLKSPALHKEYDDNTIGKYYENMFYAIKNAGGCIELADEYIKSASWVNNMIKNTQVVLAIYNTEREELDNITASSNGGIREVSNDAEIAKIDAEYETALDEITSKETKYNTQLNKLEAERTAIQTEIESLKNVAKENIASTFKLFT